MTIRKPATASVRSFLTLGCLLTVCVCTALSKEGPVVKIDLLRNGLPIDAFNIWAYARCDAPFMGYHAVRWLDAQHVLAAFNTNSLCPKTDSYHVPGNLRLITFDLQGKMLHVMNLAYEAGLESSEHVPHDGIWIGPGRTIVVESPWIVAAEGPNMNGRVRILSESLDLLQEIETESNSTAKEYGTFTHYGIHFEGVAEEREAVLFSRDNGNGRERSCLVYTGTPLSQTSECFPSDLSSVKSELRGPKSYPILNGYEANDDFPGASTDGSRSSVFITREENGLCQLAGAFCPLHGKLLVYETQSQRIVFQKEFSVLGRFALSPDGKHVAAFADDKLEIFSIR
jgi:hypothetical protein